MSLTSAMAPLPVSPQASRAVFGSTTSAPRPISRARFSWWAGFSYIAVFIAGHSSSGLRQAAIATVVSMSSAMPFASLPITFAVAGAISTRSACLARAMWATSHARSFWKRSVATGWPVRVWKVRGVTNSCAARVMTTWTP